MQFAVDTLEDFHQSGPFDAIVGRVVLLYLQKPAVVLEQLAELVRPGGHIIFQEIYMETIRTVPEAPLVTQCAFWIIETFKWTGIETNMGLRLYSIYK